MLFPRSHAWTPLQKWLIVISSAAGISLASMLAYQFERHHGLPDDSFFVGTWRGELKSFGENRAGYRFKSDHTYEERWMDGNSESWERAGKWYAGGDFIYLRHRLDDASGPYDRLELWYIDSMTPNEVHMHDTYGLHGTFKRAK